MSKIIRIKYIGHVFFYLLLTDLFQVYTHCWLKFASEIDNDVVEVTIKRMELPIFKKNALEAGVCINSFQFLLKLSRWPMLHV